MKNSSEQQQKIISYEWEVSGGDKDFLLTLATENGKISIDRRHNLPYYRCSWGYDKNTNSCRGKWEKHWDWGLCGTSDFYHPEITSDARFLTDYKFQVEQCWKMYSTGTIMYGKNVRYLSEGKFIWPL
jgi:hypothetical protein